MRFYTRDLQSAPVCEVPADEAASSRFFLFDKSDVWVKRTGGGKHEEL
jgi:hypothetical protein